MLHPTYQKRWRGDGSSLSSSSSSSSRSGLASANRRRLLMCYTLCALGAVASILAYGAYEQRSERTHFEPSTAELDRIQSQWYFFAANFHNNAAVLVQQIPIYLSLFSTLGDRNVFVSVFENGSKDDTHRLLREFAAELRARGIKHHIVLSATSSWNADGHLANVTMAQRIAFMARVRNAALLPLLQSVTAADDSKRIVKSLQQTSGNVAAAALAAAGLVGTGKGTAAGAAGAKNSAAAAPPTQDEAERTAPSVPDMEAWLRKHASEIISSSTDSPWTAAAQASSSAAKATEQQSQSASASTVASMTDYAAHAFAEFERQQHGGKVGTGKVLFVNDVFFSESDALRLIETRNGDYDMACAMDFDLVKLYDTWVARDLEGNHLSGFHPFVRDLIAQRALQREEPFQLYTCWNGMVAMPAHPFIAENLRLRTWAEGELHSANPRARAVLHSAADKTLHVADAFRIGSKCEASECLLIGKDLWARGRGKVYMNPRVRVYYNAETVFWQQWVLPAFNRWFFSWYNSFPVAKAPATAAATPALAADASDASAPVFEAARTEAPLSVECGDSMRNDVTAYSFVVAAVLLLALLLVPAVILYRLSKLCVSSAALGSSRSASATSFMPLPSGVADSAADRAGRSEGAVARLMFWARCCRRGKAHTV